MDGIVAIVTFKIKLNVFKADTNDVFQTCMRPHLDVHSECTLTHDKSCVNLKNSFTDTFMRHFYETLFSINTSGTNTTAMCVHYSSSQLGACGCWWIFDKRTDPLPGQVEYSVHTQSHTRALTDTHRQTCAGVHMHSPDGTVALLLNSFTPGRCQWRWYWSILHDSLMKSTPESDACYSSSSSFKKMIGMNTLMHTCKVIFLNSQVAVE